MDDLGGYPEHVYEALRQAERNYRETEEAHEMYGDTAYGLYINQEGTGVPVNNDTELHVDGNATVTGTLHNPEIEALREEIRELRDRLSAIEARDFGQFLEHKYNTREGRADNVLEKLDKRTMAEVAVQATQDESMFTTAHVNAAVNAATATDWRWGMGTSV